MTMFRTLSLGALAAVLSVTGLPAAAATFEYLSGTRAVALGLNGNTVGQSFTAVDNSLTSIGFQFTRGANAAAVNSEYTLNILAGDGLSGTSLYATTFTVSPTLAQRTFTFVDILLPSIATTINSRYTATLTSTNIRNLVGTGPDAQNGVTRDIYTGGQAYFTNIPYTNCSNASTSTCDLNFRFTGTTVAAIPEPATWATMFLGLSLGGVALRRRARRTVRIAA
jgi:hypothetical protein